MYFKLNKMGREKLKDGSKKIQHYFMIKENEFNIIGKKRLKVVIEKAVTKEVEHIKKGRVHNQINLIDSIQEIENENQ